jgi:enhancer of polycomb-like protein
MSRLSFRPRPLDIHKRLPILKSVREFEDEEPGVAPVASARAGVLLRHSGTELTASAANNATEGEGNQAPSKKNIQEIPTPQFDIVDTYERDYTRTFAQPTSYIRGRGGFFPIASLELAPFSLHLQCCVYELCLLRVIYICSQS